MGKCWMFEKTKEERIPNQGDWYSVGGIPCYCVSSEMKLKYPILKLTEYPSNPLEPIREVWEKWNWFIRTRNLEASGSNETADAWKAILESVRRMEGGG